MKKILMTLMLFSISFINVQAQNSPKWKHQGVYYEDQMAPGFPPFKSLITFYNDYIEIATEGDLKKGTSLQYTYSGNQGGYRVYTKTFNFGSLGKAVVNYLVDGNYNVRHIHNGQEARMWKAEEAPGSNNVGSYTGGNYGGGSYGGGSTTTGGSSSVPQQPERKHRHCNVCAGSGKCNICYGTGWVKRIGIGKDGYCPSCPNHSGRCPWCNGRGDWYE